MDNKFEEIIPHEVSEILAYWFGEIRHGLAETGKSDIWYGADSHIDDYISTHFAQRLVEASLGKWDDWLQSAKGRLAQILLFDQFSRNIYRAKAQAFAYDKLALGLCLDGMALGHDKQLSLIERIFFYHPLEHAEQPDIQEISVQQFSLLAQAFPEGEQHQLALNAYRYAVEHRDIIARFGRFPHRNQALGRAATAEEQDYLRRGGKRFGQ
ncbi:DUF924 family protein [Bowmanella pacifica]|uniref:DUF924 domain-containing protein n=1 Tax=Bowmanella pacifica TaxID=502051 RepID=A0A917Z1L2_9ALTE|nr:DUF924 family protein [Bowmanella pacifica]GGO72321.1 hypothetical protein GCM10010982_30160 [Bowmanella pacifica]